MTIQKNLQVLLSPQGFIILKILWLKAAKMLDDPCQIGNAHSFYWGKLEQTKKRELKLRTKCSKVSNRK